MATTFHANLCAPNSVNVYKISVLLFLAINAPDLAYFVLNQPVIDNRLAFAIGVTYVTACTLVISKMVNELNIGE